MVKFLFQPIFFLFLGGLAFSCFCMAQSKGDSKGNSPSYQMVGSALLSSHYIRGGLSQTQTDPALQVQFLYNLGPQVSFGFWGSNVRFRNSDEHLNLKFLGHLRVEFDAATNLELDYAHSQYFRNDTRNGSLVELQFSYEEYRVLFESGSNWNGTGTSSTHFGFGYVYSFSDRWRWKSQVEYNQISAPHFNNYFDLETDVSYNPGKLSYTVGVTYNSEAAQFQGDGDLFGYAQIKTLF